MVCLAGTVLLCGARMLAYRKFLLGLAVGLGMVGRIPAPQSPENTDPRAAELFELGSSWVLETSLSGYARLPVQLTSGFRPVPDHPISTAKATSGPADGEVQFNPSSGAAWVQIYLSKRPDGRPQLLLLCDLGSNPQSWSGKAQLLRRIGSEGLRYSREEIGTCSLKRVG